MSAPDTASIDLAWDDWAPGARALDPSDGELVEVAEALGEGVHRVRVLTPGRGRAHPGQEVWRQFADPAAPWERHPSPPRRGLQNRRRQ